MTERLRRSIHISNYFQTLEILEKKLSDKNEPKSAVLPSLPDFHIIGRARLGVLRAPLPFDVLTYSSGQSVAVGIRVNPQYADSHAPGKLRARGFRDQSN